MSSISLIVLKYCIIFVLITKKMFDLSSEHDRAGFNYTEISTMEVITKKNLWDESCILLWLLVNLWSF
jgi:hypothetical protein